MDARARWHQARVLIQDGGTDWRTVRVLDVASSKLLPDEIRWAKFTNIAWARDGSGIFYSRFAEPQKGQEFQALNENQQVYFHVLGKAQAEDTLIYATPARPLLNHTAEVTDDGAWLVVYSSEGTDDRYEVTLLDLRKAGAKPFTLIAGLEHNWSLAGAKGDTLYFITNRDAPLQKIVAIDAAHPATAPREIVPQAASTIDSASLVGDVLLVSYLVDAKSEVHRFALDGKSLGIVQLPGLGSTSGFSGEAGDPETFYSFASFNVPTAIFHYDSATGRSTPFATPRVAFNPDDFQVEQRFYKSKDGTRIPMFLLYRKGLRLGSGEEAGVPTLLYAYGGFNVSMPPSFSPANLAWAEMGGVYVLANIRGGGEYGKAWHDAGRLTHKQNVFDDFIAAGEYLISAGITKKSQLAIRGGSNGGLLIGAVVNQRPDLFAAALPQVGVMDMLRFNRFTAGRYWVDDYGDPGREADFKLLRAYSPYHNIRSGVDYPAILATTADTDDRVVPGHTFKYTAALQGREDRRQTTPGAHRNARRTWIGQAHRQADRGVRRHVGVHCAVDGACSASALSRAFFSILRRPRRRVASPTRWLRCWVGLFSGTASLRHQLGHAHHRDRSLHARIDAQLRGRGQHLLVIDREQFRRKDIQVVDQCAQRSRLVHAGSYLSPSRSSTRRIRRRVES